MGIALTPSAIDYVKGVLSRRGSGQGLRVGVKKSGCSGLAYVLDFAETVTPDDVVYEQDGIKVIVASESLAYLEGMEVDYVREGLNSFFKFNNPNVKASCGCGESFNV